ncbi:hypothetical protein EC988_005225 [Linderina pennispora]|nr:hypothetical protein EC988_005225 [Linderina pennispora]
MASTTVDNKQLLFLDTPGVVSRQALRRVSRSVVTSPWTTIAEADYLIVLLDAFKLTEKTDAVEKYLFAQLGTNSKTPAILAINKIDLVQDNDKLGEKVREYMAQYSHFVAGPVFISALGDTNVEELKQILLASTKPGDWLVPADVSSDMSDLMRVEELIRAEWFARLEGHLPYVVKQRNVGWEEVPIPPKYVAGEGEPAAVERKALVISQELVVSSKGEAKILTGAGGSVILGISRSANVNISKALGRPVRLHLQVIVEEDTRLGSIMGVAVLLRYTIVPDEEKILKSMSPELRAEYERNKEKRRAQHDAIMAQIIENSKSDKPIWDVKPAPAPVSDGGSAGSDKQH